jgi:predicted ATP-grasp superfamily ATP-dependent carboligase
MRIFLYEFFCANLSGAPSLQAEGGAMLAAVVADFASCPGVEPVTFLDPRFLSLAAGWPGNVRVEAPEWERPGDPFGALAAAADFSLVIAPECDGILAAHCRRVEESGGRLLGPSPSAVGCTTDKLELSQRFLDLGVPTPPTVAFPTSYWPPWPRPWVCKPRDGAGSQDTFRIDREQALDDCFNQVQGERWMGGMILQPYAPGLAASVACLVGPGRCLPLPAAEQKLSTDGRFHYEGGSLPLSSELNERAQRLAVRAVQAVPGLLGYVGVDLVLGEAADGSEDAVIEINPRLTTSYVGLRRLARFNLAEALLAVATGGLLPQWDWNSQTIHFSAAGRILG